MFAHLALEIQGRRGSPLGWRRGGVCDGGSHSPRSPSCISHHNLEVRSCSHPYAMVEKTETLKGNNNMSKVKFVSVELRNEEGGRGRKSQAKGTTW